MRDAQSRRRVDSRRPLCYSPLHLLHTEQHSPSGSAPYYSIKYVGITNGEIGVLSHRKPLPSPYRTQCDETESWEAAAQRLPAEFVRPTPEKYDQFMVHKYSRPRGLSTVRKNTEQTAGERLRRRRRSHSPRQVSAGRTGVSGWKLTRRRSHFVTKARPFTPSPLEAYVHRLPIAKCQP